jgi:L-ascorbate metabolism protein UlaG (beta-lactamase superfamily)
VSTRYLLSQPSLRGWVENTDHYWGCNAVKLPRIPGVDTERVRRLGLSSSIFSLALVVFLLLGAHGAELGTSVEKAPQTSTHFNGSVYFNPEFQPVPASRHGREPKRGGSRWIWRWLFGNDWPEWPEIKDVSPGPPPAVRVPKGALRITPVGHSTFLIQMDEVNILIDPIWSNRCSPVSWAGPKRRTPPGIRFEELPPIDFVLVSHNHYDHLDLPTLKRLAKRGTPSAIVTLGNQDLVQDAGIPTVHALDWWQSVRLSPDVTVTLVPAQHFSSRTLWDRNKTLWGGFVVSGQSGNVFYSGDTGYGPHFREIARRFSPIRVALLPISPFQPQQSTEPPREYYPSMHMGPAEAVQAHVDLDAELSIAAHFRVFQLGPDGFDDAVNKLASALKERDLKPDAFIAPTPGQAIELSARLTTASSPVRLETSGANR